MFDKDTACEETVLRHVFPSTTSPKTFEARAKEEDGRTNNLVKECKQNQKARNRNVAFSNTLFHVSRSRSIRVFPARNQSVII